MCFTWILLLAYLQVSTSTAPSGLRADGTNLMAGSGLPQYALSSLRPKLEWTLPKDPIRGAEPKSYRIKIHQVTSSENSSDGNTSMLVWDSGIVESALPYTTTPQLSSAALYEWTVETVSSSGFTSVSSSPARFRISLLGETPWQGVPWLGSDTLNVYRTTFSMPAELPSDVVFYVCGLGYSHITVNGKDLPGDIRLVSAPWTNNERLNGFSTYDIRALLMAGANNTITVTLGSGWRTQKDFPYKDKGQLGNDTVERVLRAQLRTSPSQIFMQTGDATWEAAAGPIVFDSVYDGETYNATMEDNLQWGPAPVIASDAAPRGKMVLLKTSNCTVH